MTAVVLAILVGFTIGHLLHLEDWASRFFHRLVKTMHLGGDNIDMEFYITAEPITPPASTEIQLTITPIGIGFPSFSFPFSSVFHFTVEKRLWQAKENRTAEAVRFRKVLLTLRSRRSA